MPRDSLPIAGPALRREAMRRTLQHQADISAGRVRYVKPGAANPAVHREKAVALEERIFQLINSLEG